MGGGNSDQRQVQSRIVKPPIRFILSRLGLLNDCNLYSKYKDDSEFMHTNAVERESLMIECVLILNVCT